MSKKKSLITILAVALICVISVAGTLAYLTDKTSGSVVNTFTAAGGGKLIGTDGSFTLEEHVVEDQEDGTYALGDDTTASNSYVVIPGVNLPKDPFITITGKTDVPAYLYVEVVDNFTGSALSYELDDCWLELSGVQGATEQGVVYVYAKNGVAEPVTDETDLSEVNILKDKQVVVADEEDLGITEGGVQLKFYGYLAQSAVTKDGKTSTSETDVYDVCF